MSQAEEQIPGVQGARHRRTINAAGVVLFAVGIAVTACASSTSHVAPTTTTASTGTARPSTTSAPTTTQSTMSAAPTTEPPTPTLPPSLGSYLALFPFSTLQDVQAWQRSYESGGHEPWHLDAGQTALAFAAWLGFTETDTVIRVRTDAIGAHVSVGFHTGPGNLTATSAIVHLERWGSGSDAPWEVVGTDDTTFSLTRPAYGATVTSPLTAGGLITGVDENTKVQVRTSSSVVGTLCCRPEGGVNTSWGAVVSFTASSGAVLTITAQTGGHIAGVERFTVTGVRVR